MAKAQTMKPKSSFGDWIKRITGGEKKKPATRPGVPGQASTLTNIPAGSATRGGAQKDKLSSTSIRKPKAKEAASRLAELRLPFIGDRPFIAQMKILATLAVLLFIATGLMVAYDTTTRTQKATHISIASQMQFHTQRLAKAAGLAARGQASAFPQLADSREQFADYLNTLRKGGFALGVKVDTAATSAETTSRIEDLEKRWPQSSNAAGAILSAQKDLSALAQNIAQIRVGAEEMATHSQELTGLMTQSGSSPSQVLRANRITFLSERLGRGAAEILGSETIDPEVPFLIGKDTNDLRSLIAALESGNEATGMVALRDAEARTKLAELKKTFIGFEQNASPILRELQKLVSARQAGAQLVAASEQLQSAVRSLQEGMQAEAAGWTLIAVLVLATLLVLVLALMALVFLADSRRSAADAESENRRNQEAILRLLNEMGDLADGDLTIRAQVTEDITGAIADSMNYTIDELRTLVAGVNNAADRKSVV